jgi:hypothetical protein
MNLLLKIIKKDGLWVSGQYKGQFFQAKICDEPSKFGIRGGRTSKLVICSTPAWDSEAVVVEYDRGFQLSDIRSVQAAEELAYLLDNLVPVEA